MYTSSNEVRFSVSKEPTMEDDSLRKLKDRKSVVDSPVFQENYGKCMMATGMYGRPVFALLNVSWTLGNLVFLIYTAYHSIAIDYDLGLFSGTIHYVLMAISATFSIVNCNKFKNNLEQMVVQIEEGFHDYEDTLDPESEEEIKKMLGPMKIRKLAIAKSFFYLILVTLFVSMVAFPILFGDKTVKDDNIHRNLPVKTWYLFSTDVSWIGWSWLVFSEYWIAYVIGVVVMGTDIPYVCFAEEGVFQMKALGISVRNIHMRANYVYERRFRKTFYTSKKHSQNFNACLRECLNHSVKHHYKIIRYFKHMNDLYFYLLLIIMLGSTFLLCLAGVLFVSNEVGMNEKLQFLAYLIAEIFHTFVFTWYGEMISESSMDVGEQLYKAQWQKHSAVMKYHVLIMEAYMKKPIVISAGGFMISNLNTFGNVLSSAYSYFNLLSVMMDRGSEN